MTSTASSCLRVSSCLPVLDAKQNLFVSSCPALSERRDVDAKGCGSEMTTTQRFLSAVRHEEINHPCHPHQPKETP